VQVAIRDANRIKTKILYLNKIEIFEILDLILNETFVSFGGQIFRQVKGVPMGNACSPCIADLTLLMMEYKYMKRSGKVNWRAARYIDDLLVIGVKDFLNICQDIYGNELKLEVAYQGSVGNFLDISLQYQHGLPTFGVYNKTDAFNFSVNRFSYPDSFVSNQVHRAIIIGQLIRYARICSNRPLFITRCQEIFGIYLQRGFLQSFLYDLFFKFAATYRSILMKFGILDKAHVCQMAGQIFI